MPIYEYRCNECQTVFPRLQRVGATADGVRCPECGSTQVARKPSTFASAASGPTVGASSGGCGSGGFT